MTLWHFTCEHGGVDIGERGLLIPNRHPLLSADLLWLTDRPDRSRRSLGLTSLMLACDRMAYRYRIEDHEAAEPWFAWADRNGVKRGALVLGDPRCWWVSTVPLMGERDGR